MADQRDILERIQSDPAYMRASHTWDSTVWLLQECREEIERLRSELVKAISLNDSIANELANLKERENPK